MVVMVGDRAFERAHEIEDMAESEEEMEDQSVNGEDMTTDLTDEYAEYEQNPTQ
jgi:hypothetical protein